jgi:hypothetical protein
MKRLAKHLTKTVLLACLCSVVGCATVPRTSENAADSPEQAESMPLWQKVIAWVIAAGLSSVYSSAAQTTENFSPGSHY